MPTGAPPVPTTVAATSWIVADLDSGEVYGALGPHRRQVPASIFKVLMSATVLPKLDPATKVEPTCEDNYGWGSEWDQTPWTCHSHSAASTPSRTCSTPR